MDERKRPRLEVITNGGLNRGTCQRNIFLNTSNVTELISGVAASTVSTTTTTGAAVAPSTLPGNIFLTICEDNSSQSREEFYTIDTTKSTISTTTQTLAPGTTTTTTIASVTPRKLGLNVGLSAINAKTAAALLPATVQLPSGCEIYLVKEYVDPPPLTPTNAPRTVISSSLSSSPSTKYQQTGITSTPKTPVATTTKYESLSGTKSSLQIVRKSVPIITQNNSTQIVNNNVHQNHNNNNNKNNHNNASSNQNIDIDEQRSEFDKQSELLEAYKKRDDKRRATHNEVERRRRDKINNWIFKLKEMLPSEIPNVTSTTTTTASIDSESCMNNNSNSNSSTSDQQQQQQQGHQRSINSSNNNGCRNLPCDSKSQILIKACEYIKSMQQEMKSLRECLTENENLRQYNESLQNELNQLKNEQQLTTTTALLSEEENHDDDDDGNDNCVDDDDDDVVVSLVHCNGHLTVNDSDDAVDGHADDLTHNLNSNPNSNFNVTLNSLNNLGGNGDSLFMTTSTNNNVVHVIDGKRDLLLQNYVD